MPSELILEYSARGRQDYYFMKYTGCVSYHTLVRFSNEIQVFNIFVFQ